MNIKEQTLSALAGETPYSLAKRSGDYSAAQRFWQRKLTEGKGWEGLLVFERWLKAAGYELKVVKKSRNKKQ